MKDEEKNDFDGYLDLAKEAAGRFDKRRAYEWKITIGFWILILATLHEDFKDIVLPTLWWAIGCAAFVFLWLRGVWVANQNDKERYEYYRARAARALIVDEPLPEFPIKMTLRGRTLAYLFGFLFGWAAIFQAVVTIGLCYIGWATRHLNK